MSCVIATLKVGVLGHPASGYRSPPRFQSTDITRYAGGGVQKAVLFAASGRHNAGTCKPYVSPKEKGMR